MDVLSDAVTAMRTGRPHSNRTRRAGGWAMRFRPVSAAGFHVVLEGSCWLLPKDHEPVRLGAGDVVCLLPQVIDYAVADDPDTPLAEVPVSSLSEALAGPPSAAGGPVGATVMLCGAYLLDERRPHPLLAELPRFIHLPARVGSRTELRAAVDLLGSELDRPGQGSDVIVPALLDMLLLYILRAWYSEQVAQGVPIGWAGALADAPVSAALRAIHRDPARQWTVERLGAEGGLSRAAFARRFSALVGRPPLAYLTWWRMTLAARMLRESDAPLHAVATRTGYASEFAFAKAFKREFGTAPGGYRKATERR
ncbi:AraC family transcriptional regulator [Pseudonocardia eucalypti]|uniref:AraC family transcriptional regulator n=1 Tax=Pseudonocardia eucalypti TaxID=648755 RepID=A0ABP9QWS8_9PSEU|nr:AraC-like DNA-binding protein [Pseudonocardia eucalypti]